MRVTDRIRETLDKLFVSLGAIHSVCCVASIIENTENAWWSVLLDQVTHNLVVEELDWGPFDAYKIIITIIIREDKRTSV